LSARNVGVDDTHRCHGRQGSVVSSFKLLRFGEAATDARTATDAEDGVACEFRSRFPEQQADEALC
jgi:hypothetical protein